MSHFDGAFIVFIATLALSFAMALWGRFKSDSTSEDEDLAGRNLNKWLVGLSAGATGNSGFIVTGAVGLGYLGGLQAIWLPLAWMVGDLVYWKLFPHRLNDKARQFNAITLSEYLNFGLSGVWVKRLSILMGIVLVTLLIVYTSAQWLAGRKFLSSIYDFSDATALLFFSGTIIAYSAIGGFRGSILVDTTQAIIRLVGTVLALGLAVHMAIEADSLWQVNVANAGDGFLNPFTLGSVWHYLAFIGGFAAAAIGFGLGQPQIVSRYFACSSPDEVAKSKWIYIGFLQFTWISMTLFGVVLRGLMPELDDPEQGLGVFFKQHFGAVVAGLIFADVYATIAATSNSVLVATAQIVKRDILTPMLNHKVKQGQTSYFWVLLIGFASILVSFVSSQSVFTAALAAVSLVGAAIAAPMIIKTFSLVHSAFSLTITLIMGFLGGLVWQQLGFNQILNEACVGMLCGLLTNYIWSTFNSSEQVFASQDHK